MNSLYKFVEFSESEEILERARKDGWGDECFLAQSVNKESPVKGYFIPIYRIESLTRVSRENLANHLVTHMLHIVGKSKIDLLDDDKWRFNWTLTREQYKRFRGYAIPLFKKVYKCNRLKAENNFDWFYQQFGLRIKG